MKRIGMLSGGEASWAAMKRDVERRGVEGLINLFCDTKAEDEDTYRFLRDCAENIGAHLVIAADGRTLWEVFKDERMIGNNRLDVCSKLLKREVARKYLAENASPGDTVLLGYTCEEVHRFKKAKPRYEAMGYRCEAPLCEPPYLSAKHIREWVEREGLKRQRMYIEGFPHANCSGFCVRAGKSHFRHLLKVRPELYKYHEQKEQEMREYLGKDVAILKQTFMGRSRPLTLRTLRERAEGEDTNEDCDWGGCGCFSEDD